MKPFDQRARRFHVIIAKERLLFFCFPEHVGWATLKMQDGYFA